MEGLCSQICKSSTLLLNVNKYNYFDSSTDISPQLSLISLRTATFANQLLLVVFIWWLRQTILKVVQGLRISTMRLASRNHGGLPAAMTTSLALASLQWLGDIVAAQAAGAQKPISVEGPRPDGRVNVNGGGNPLTEAFGKTVKGWLEDWHVPGLAIGVVDGDNTWTKVCTLDG